MQPDIPELSREQMMSVLMAPMSSAQRAEAEARLGSLADDELRFVFEMGDHGTDPRSAEALRLARLAGGGSGGSGVVGEPCDVCGNTPATKRCGNCSSRRYCSKSCQIKDWPEHSAPCKKKMKNRKKNQKKKKKKKKKIQRKQPTVAMSNLETTFLTALTNPVGQSLAGNAIVTYNGLTSSMEMVSGNFDIRLSTDGTLIYTSSNREDTLSRLHNCMGGGFIIRVFGTRVGAALPPKFIYSFEFQGQNVQRLSPEENRANNCVDSSTGRALEPEPGCFYC
jgi:hypothetical protein